MLSPSDDGANFASVGNSFASYGPGGAGTNSGLMNGGVASAVQSSGSLIPDGPAKSLSSEDVQNTQASKAAGMLMGESASGSWGECLDLTNVAIPYSAHEVLVRVGHNISYFRNCYFVFTMVVFVGFL